MNKQPPLSIPAGIRYIGDWGEFSFSKFPIKCIIDKKLPGCGFTEYCIRSHENVILCSPRKILLQNKYDQHPGEVYLVRNELDPEAAIDIDISVVKKPKEDPDGPSSAERTGVIQRIQTELRHYVTGSLGKSKILVTYDSFWLVKDFLKSLGVFDQFYVVIDEFQAILQDSRFKSSTEMSFLNTLSDCQSIYVSATPMMENYLDQIPEFKDLPYYELDWTSLDPTRLVKPNIQVKLMRSLSSITEKIISGYRQNGFFAETYGVGDNGLPIKIYSKEAVFFVNSVDRIGTIIKDNNLADSEVNILCSNTDENQKKLWRKIGVRKSQGLYKIGSVPVKGAPRKAITICTRTVYLGADFYSDNASSYIFSDSNINCMAVDIALDLPQILGRQRLSENPWKNEATLYYKTTTDFRKISSEDFEKLIAQKIKATKDLILTYEEAPEERQETIFKVYNTQIRVKHYNEDYMSFDQSRIKTDDGKYRRDVNVVFNNLVYLSERRAFDIQQGMYGDQFMVFSSISENFGIHNEILPVIKEFLENYQKIRKISERLKYLCGFSESNPALVSLVLDQIPESDLVKKYFSLGPDECRSCAYDVTRLNKKLNIILFSKEVLQEAIYYHFKEGDKYTLKDLKSVLVQIYDTISYSKAPKATDIEEFFKVKKCKLIDSSVNKYVHGYELIKKLL